MQQELVTARKHPAALAAIVIASLAVTALALVTIAYLLGWVPTHGTLPAGPGSIAIPGQQLAGTVQGGVDLLPGETLVAPADKPAAPAPLPAPIYTQPPAPAPSTTHATVLPSRAAPSKPTYNREARVTSFERSTRNICVNCGTIASIGTAGGDWEVRVRFDDGSTETMRYPDRPRLRIGERVHLEDGRLLPE